MNKHPKQDETLRERLLAQVRARLERFSAGPDPGAVLDPQALAEVTALLKTDPAADLEVAHAAGWLHWFRYLLLEPGEDQQDLDAALTLLTPVYRMQPDAVPDQLRAHFDEGRRGSSDTPEAWADRAIALLQETRRTGDRVSLDTAIDVLRRVLDATVANHPDRVMHLSNLGIALRIRFARTGAPADLDAAITAGREAVEATPANHPDRAAYLSNLGIALHTRFARTGAPADLDAAITAGREAVEATPANHPDRAAYLSNLGIALHTRFARTGAPADLDAAITAGREAVEATPANHPDRAAYLSNLGIALQTRFGWTGQSADLDAAITTGREAVEAVPAGHPDRTVYLSNLSAALRTRFERTGTPADLDAAITAGREAVAAAPDDHPERAGRLSNLGGALLARFARTGEMADLDEAVAASGAAVAATPEGHPDRAGRLSNLGVALQRRFERVGGRADLDEAVEAGREAVAAAPDDHPDRATMLSSLGVALQRRFERVGGRADLDEAVEAGRAAVAATPDDHLDRAAMLANIGVALWTRFGRVGGRADLDEAVEAGRAAVAATPDDHPDRAGRLSNLAGALQTRFERSGALADLDEAIEASRAAVAVEAAPPLVRAVAAQGWGRAAAAGERWAEAVEGFETAVGLLGRVAPHSLTRGDQEHLLADLGGLGSAAAACCVHAGLVGRAVELFEQGRGVLLGQALDTRADLTALAERHPALAGRFADLRDRLDRPEDSAERLVVGPAEAEGAGAGPLAALAQRGRRRETAEAFDQVIAEIRSEPGFAGFLQPPSIHELMAVAAGGAIVIVNVSAYGSHALVVTAAGVGDPVRLPALTPDVVYEQVIAFMDAISGTLASLGSGPQPGGRPVDAVLADIQAWLWDVLAGPVLDRLGINGPPVNGAPWPRMWWCLSGLLSFLPVHAAGRHDTWDEPAPATVVDRVVSSYTPTIRALGYARRPHAAGASTASTVVSGPGLVVAMPETPGASDLPGAAAEAAILRELAPGRVTEFTSQAALRESVLAKMTTARWAHFACHGHSDLDYPSASSLLLYDYRSSPLTVADISRLRLEDAELAFLSASSTARPGSRLADEAIHMTSAFLLAGYRHVIGTLWPIDDTIAVTVAEDIYVRLAAPGDTDVAGAVHAVTRRMRNRWADHPSLWASYIHCGA